MATMTLGTASLPLPRWEDPVRMEYLPIGSGRRMANGTLRVQAVAGKWRVQVNWEGLTAAERATLWGAYGGYCVTAGLLTMPDGLTATVVTVLGSWQEKHWWDGAGTLYYDVAFVMDEV